MNNGKVLIAGAGPGDLGLVTLAVFEAVKEADVILYDQLAPEALLAFAKKSAEKIWVGKTGKGEKCRSTRQDEINQLMFEKTSHGKNVLRLKGGDPFIFGRGSEECEFLHERGIAFEILPGVSSATAVPAYAGIPLTHRELSRSVSFATGHLMEGAAAEEIVIPKSDTLVFLMGIKNLPVLVSKLREEGCAAKTPCALIEKGTTPEQRTFTGTLETIEKIAIENHVEPPTLFVVGEVVQLAKQVRWFENKPLFGKTIVVTRAPEQASSLSKQLRQLGANVSECPTIVIQKIPNDNRHVYNAAGFAAFTDFIFTSENAVVFFFENLHASGADARALSGKQIHAIGPKTAKALLQQGIRADQLPKTAQAEGILAILPENLKGRNFLLPRAKNARTLLLDEIGRRGGKVEEWLLYESLPPQNLSLLPLQIDGICFTSASTVIHFVRCYPKTSREIPIFAIGEITAQTARDHHFSHVHLAANASIESLVATLQRYFQPS